MSSITLRTTGKTIETVWKCGNIVEFRFTDGTTLKLGWRDAQGELIKGEPSVLFEGKVVRAKHAIAGRGVAIGVGNG